MKLKFIKESQRKTIPRGMEMLPSDLVTHDAADRERIHPNDPAHIVKALMKQRARAAAREAPPVVLAQAAVAAVFDSWSKDPIKVKQLAQDWVDIWRSKVILNWAQKPLIEYALHHLWFPDPHRADSVELRVGPPPARGDRPKHLKNLNLEVQVLDWPTRLRDIVKDAGADPAAALEEIDVAIRMQKARQAVAAAAQDAGA